VNLRMKRAFEWEGLDVRKKTKRERKRERERERERGCMRSFVKL